MSIRKSAVLFSGKLTPELRKFIRQRRETLGITLQQLSRVLHVNWTTIRKWEDGRTKACRQYHIFRLTRFLSGEYDEILGKMNTTASVTNQEHPKGVSPMLGCIERIHNMYRLCDDYPEIGQRLLDDVHEILQDVANRLLGYSSTQAMINNPLFTQEGLE